ncbi:hypothetical protein HOE31_03945 [bacterium]|jgi:predicted Zn-ribbon and HTH transcriptional regulator|nr:hypothetical protein [bacterium]MBT4122071.1 hypothetical protein [bacterium]MBT4335290.1 hypothetical protein [bacterium]MBT4495636.1 hypothetical protein [bacterium]MBT4764112.1 hypothetical protein [bacterium]
METQDSILDTIISTKQATVLNEFSPKKLVNLFLQLLSTREKEIIILRHGLDGNSKRTLEKIGNKFNVTRERIRQIENSALKKIKKSSEFIDALEGIESIFNQTLEEHGGIMPEFLLIERSLSTVNDTTENKAYASFLLNYLVKESFSFAPNDSNYESIWKLSSSSMDDFDSLRNKVLQVLEGYNKPVTIENIYKNLLDDDKFPTDDLSESILDSLLHLAKKIDSNPFDEWGLSDWNTITLKKISDKVYLILKKEGKPLHFNKIAKKIDSVTPSKKNANPATIHNELILDEKYVLVGRGMYGLKEWGYKPGTVGDVITEILKNNDKPLSRDEIIEQVLDKRFVKKSTIILALMDKSKFTRDEEGKYLLKN